MKDKPPLLGKETVGYIAHKWYTVFPQHLVAFAVTFITTVCFTKLHGGEIVVRFVKSLPNLFLVQRIGLYSSDIIGEEWYISAMLLALAVLYPVCRKHYDIFARVIAPVAGVILVGYLYQKYGNLSNASKWDGFFYKSQIRGAAEICLGVFAFEGSRFLAKLQLSKIQKGLLSIIEYGCYALVVIFSCSVIGTRYDVLALYALLIAVCLSFSNVTYGTTLFQNKVCYFLGRISLPLYLSQRAVRDLVRYTCSDWSIPLQFGVIVVLNLLLALVVDFLGHKLKSKMDPATSTMMSTVV